MAEQKKLPIPALPQTAYTTKQGKRRKTLEEKREAKRAASRRRQESCRTRVYIGAAFDRWKNLKDSKGLKSDAELALLLLDSYERGCPAPTHGQRLPSRGSRSAPDRDQAQTADVQPLNGNSPAEETGLYQVEVSVDWDDDTWEAETHEGVPLTSSEEDLTLEVNSEDDEDSDEEYVHPVCVRPAGALNTELCLRDRGDDSGSGPDPAADVHVET
ncbi:uncharacterized protein LOC119023820 isoform X1 [Acanthopagrus latus]|uniref:uncharacterized protein LOC119023820 isoform X1 n=2 Tax=Acanthopagrus latus TaxID=8177 RepID=UPI00187C3EA2|nr:uncharacterized protein LOC119023820 isoform X1 [Acanthopagrus latus]XP_036961914.1 uncharacterized protein LOC119023820 isoform X1 [Acanthopagrus latus]